MEWLVKHYAGRKMPFDMLIIDELSSFKNSRAKRFLALKKVLGQFTRVIGLTGTPAPNGLEDLWPQIYLLDRGARLGRTMRSYLDMYFDTPNSWLPYKRELKPGAEEAIYQRISDICVSMRAADHLKMPERVDNGVELRLSAREEKLYRQMERDMLLPTQTGMCWRSMPRRWQANCSNWQTARFMTSSIMCACFMTASWTHWRISSRPPTANRCW